MKMAEFGVEYLFHPVGQGLFASGRLLSEKNEIFNWDYDCGSMSEKNVEAAIHNFQVKDDTIDLLAISHFDKDHVSGVVKLLEENKVDTIILLYLALPIRILQAVQSDGEISLEYTEFILNPFAFFNRIARDIIKQIVFVLPIDQDELLDDEHPGKDPEGKADSKKAKLNFNPVKKPEEFLDDLKLNAEDSKKISVTQKPFWVFYENRVIWEFIPHNDEKLSENISRDFLEEISEKIDRFRRVDDAIGRKEILKAIRTDYEACFGKTKSNEISLFLYGGPILKRERGLIGWHQFPSNHYFDGPFARNFCCFYGGCVFCSFLRKSHSAKISILYTGDGNLRKSDGTKNENYITLENRLTKKRIGQLLALQAPHHGAKDNWPLGLASEISPDFSVFSAREGNKHHPHEVVLSDFKKNK
jgi:hypothetical protein